MKRHRTECALIALFVAGMLLPLARHWAPARNAVRLGENRRQAEAPRLPTTLAAARQFPHDFDAYWNDSFGFRDDLIQLHAQSKLAFGVASMNDVVRGRDGWLFYTGDHSMEIHRGERPMSPEELVAWQRELEARADWMAARGGHYIVVIAPNKESIYGEMLAEGYEKRGATRLDQLVLHMSAHSRVKILDLRGALLEEKTRQQVYTLTDTHWNDHGAYIAYREISRHLAGLYPQMQARPRDSFTVRALPPWYGDLVQMLGMAGLMDEPRDELVPHPDYASSDTPSTVPASGRRWASMRGSAEGPRAVVFHDSFFLPPEERGDAARAATAAKSAGQSAFRMVPLLAEYFSSSVFTWSHEFDPELVQRQDATLVVQEMVERVLSGPPQGRAPQM
ncbi:hypothetical protein LZC95_39655 [Pendulispora brunnea]|uniref:AlgX/AlgJ SGNH hydrolase-like domain-containing protein n=1 Tax=Pendulispora brunnea TaxID=2905690 RepID=A0ABZ2K1D7_9BACT